MIRLVGPGGAGKTTAGQALANRLGIPFVDLDEQFGLRIGDISAYLTAYGYEAFHRSTTRRVSLRQSAAS
jgi:shikimate kinase